MQPPRSCCGPCSNLGWCSTETNCCIECHMSWEEEVCGPYLPPPLLAQLKAEHRRLIAAGLPSGELLAHSKWEEAIFARYVPPEVLRQVRIDHSEYEQGNLRSRDAVMRP